MIAPSLSFKFEFEDFLERERESTGEIKKKGI
jgi:hypothetical protein